MIRSILLLLSVALLGLSPAFSLAWAAGPGPYVELQGLGTYVLAGQSDSATGSFNLKYDPGYGGALAIGYDLAEAYPDFGQGRVELEASSRTNTLTKAEFKEGSVAADGEIRVESLLLNTFAEYHRGSNLVPYLGFGLGYARVTMKQATVYGQPFADDSAGVLAFQGGLGVGLEVSDHLTFDLGYRFFGTLKPSFKSADGSSFDAKYSSHNALLGLRVRF